MGRMLTDFQLVTSDLLCYRDRTAVLVTPNPDGSRTITGLETGKRRTLNAEQWDAYLDYALWDGARLEPGLPWEREDETEQRGNRMGIAAR